MNKFQLYRHLREELAVQYEKELHSVEALQQGGVDELAGNDVRLTCGESESLVTNGESNKAFREEIREAMRLILERYERNLRREIDALGLAFENESWTDTPTNQNGQQSRSNGSRGVERH